MICFGKLWETVHKKGVSTYFLREHAGIDSKTIRRQYRLALQRAHTTSVGRGHVPADRVSGRRQAQTSLYAVGNSYSGLDMSPPTQ